MSLSLTSNSFTNEATSTSSEVGRAWSAVDLGLLVPEIVREEHCFSVPRRASFSVAVDPFFDGALS
jgi:hypothetical protein